MYRLCKIHTHTHTHTHSHTNWYKRENIVKICKYTFGSSENQFHTFTRSYVMSLCTQKSPMERLNGYLWRHVTWHAKVPEKWSLKWTN